MSGKHAPIDTRIAVPDAVRRAAQHADSLQAQHIQLLSGDPPPVTQQDPPPAPPVTQQDPPPAPPAPPAPPEHQDNPTDPFEQRYKAMKGRHDALKARSDNTIAELNGRIGELERELNALRSAAPPAPHTPSPSTPNPTLQQLREEGENLIGTEMYELVERLAEAKARELVGGVEQRINSVAQAVTGLSQNEMFAYLDRNQPGWRATNHDQAFIGWLNLRDPASGAIRKQLLEDAFNKGDAQRVQFFFKSFISDVAPPTPPSGEVPPTPAPGTPAPASQRIPLHELAAPGRARSSAPPVAPGEKRTYKQSEIGRFFSDKARGMWNGREAEALAMEQDIFLAQTENRVVPG
jgi:hypothetical protein